MSDRADGLFKAMGKTAKPVAVRNEDGSYEKRVVTDRRPEDFYATAAGEVTRALLAYEQQPLSHFGAVWEPAAGAGHMARILREVFPDVRCSDIVDRGCGAEIQSFYDYGHNSVPARAVITNPPFNECSWKGAEAHWIRHGLDVLGLEYMALLLPLSWAAAGGLRHLWARRPPARVLLMTWRIDFTGQGAQPASHAWYVWDGVTRPEDTRFLRIDRVDHRQGAIL